MGAVYFIPKKVMVLCVIAFFSAGISLAEGEQLLLDPLSPRKHDRVIPGSSADNLDSIFHEEVHRMHQSAAEGEQDPVVFKQVRSGIPWGGLLDMYEPRPRTGITTHGTQRGIVMQLPDTINMFQPDAKADDHLLASKQAEGQNTNDGLSVEDLSSSLPADLAKTFSAEDMMNLQPKGSDTQVQELKTRMIPQMMEEARNRISKAQADYKSMHDEEHMQKLEAQQKQDRQAKLWADALANKDAQGVGKGGLLHDERDNVRASGQSDGIEHLLN